MPELLKVASDWFETVRDAENVTSIVYSRGADSVTIDASTGSTVWNVDGVNIFDRWISVDWILLRAELILNSAVITPERGDQIVETRGSKTYTYQVVSPTGQRVYRDADGFHKSMKIHTKLFSET
jgi:hypothetical protein